MSVRVEANMPESSARNEVKYQRPQTRSFDKMFYADRTTIVHDLELDL